MSCTDTYGARFVPARDSLILSRALHFAPGDFQLKMRSTFGQACCSHSCARPQSFLGVSDVDLRGAFGPACLCTTSGCVEHHQEDEARRHDPLESRSTDWSLHDGGRPRVQRDVARVFDVPGTREIKAKCLGRTTRSIRSSLASRMSIWVRSVSPRSKKKNPLLASCLPSRSEELNSSMVEVFSEQRPTTA